jgi:hypothetical protein
MMSKKEDERAERKAKKKLRKGKSPKTAASPFVHEEMCHYKQGKHGKSRKQAIAIGISKARRHGVPYPGKGKSRGSDGRTAPKERSKSSLHRQAKRMGIEGRSKMDKKQLARAIRKAS